MLKYSIALIMTVVSVSVYAAAGSTGYVEISDLRFGGGFTRVTGKTQFIDPGNCSGDGTNKNAVVLIHESTASYNEMVSAILSARAIGTPVLFWVSGCQTDSGVQYPGAHYVYF